MAKYRKKPIVIEAMQFLDTKESFDECRKFTNGAFIYDYQESPFYFVETLEGSMAVTKEDFIIKGVKGEFYSCRKDIFEQTYEKVEE
jgi:hypothetical protein